MNDFIPPQPVLAYHPAGASNNVWLAKFVCIVAMINGTTDVGTTVCTTFMQRSAAPDDFTILPIGICGLAIVIFAIAGLFQISRARFAIGFLSGISVILNWISRWIAVSFALTNGGFDRSLLMLQSIYAVRYAIAPVLVIVCLQHHSVRRLFH